MTEAADAPRIGPLPRAEWTDEARAVFAFWEGEAARENGSRSNTMMTLANHPRLALSSLELGRYMLVDSTISQRQRELIILRVAWRFGSDYQWAHHVNVGRGIGMTETEFQALATDGVAPFWNGEEAALIGAIDQLCAAGRIDDATWATLAEGMDRHQLMDFLYSVGFFTMNAWAFGAMGIRLEPEFTAFSTPAHEMVAARRAGITSADRPDRPRRGGGRTGRPASAAP